MDTDGVLSEKDLCLPFDFDTLAMKADSTGSITVIIMCPDCEGE
jgi:hypothetical protein